jgi:hypothetical protein
MTNQEKLPDVFGDLVSSEAYSNIAGIDQKSLENEASRHDALIRIGEIDYIRLSTLLLGQLDKILSSGRTGQAILNNTQTINTIDSVGRLRGITYRLSTLSAPKEVDLREIFSKMLLEDDPDKLLELAHEYRDVYGELDRDVKTVEVVEDRLKKVIAKERLR